MQNEVEITCPKCSKTFRHSHEAKIPKGKLTCPHCRQTFNCHACNYSWAKWARERGGCGSPCEK